MPTWCHWSQWIQSVDIFKFEYRPFSINAILIFYIEKRTFISLTENQRHCQLKTSRTMNKTENLHSVLTGIARSMWGSSLLVYYVRDRMSIRNRIVLFKQHFLVFACFFNFSPLGENQTKALNKTRQILSSRMYVTQSVRSNYDRCLTITDLSFICLFVFMETSMLNLYQDNRLKMIIIYIFQSR
jgi:hypothetical protein